jgi:TrmH family RNA methyltransferase
VPRGVGVRLPEWPLQETIWSATRTNREIRVSYDLISSPSNPRVKFALGLRDAKNRRLERRILIDGPELIARAVASGVEICELFVRDSELNRNEALSTLVHSVSSQTRRLRLADIPMDRIQYGDRRLDAIAVAIPPASTLVALEKRLGIEGSAASATKELLENGSAGVLFLVLDRMEKPGNLGAALRTADAVGVRAVLLSDPISETWNPNAMRASLGAIFTVPLATASAVEIQAWLSGRNVSCFSARADRGASYTQVAYPARTALVIGNEAEGLQDRWDGPESQAIHIPMQGRIDSLNASVSGALLMFEVRRQWQVRRALEKSRNG